MHISFTVSSSRQADARTVCARFVRILANFNASEWQGRKASSAKLGESFTRIVAGLMIARVVDMSSTRRAKPCSSQGRAGPVGQTLCALHVHFVSSGACAQPYHAALLT